MIIIAMAFTYLKILHYILRLHDLSLLYASITTFHVLIFVFIFIFRKVVVLKKIVCGDRYVYFLLDFDEDLRYSCKFLYCNQQFLQSSLSAPCVSV